MFTGIIEDIGTITQLEKKAESVLMTIRHSGVLNDLKEGDSIAVDGVCLTVTSRDDRSFSVEASAETAGTTTLGAKRPMHRVHLERALTFSGRLGGHLVTGHVDEQGKVVARLPQGRSLKAGIPKLDGSPAQTCPCWPSVCQAEAGSAFEAQQLQRPRKGFVIE